MFANLKRRIKTAQFFTLHKRSLKAIHQWQNEKLADLVHHAYRNVSMWQGILQGVGFTEQSRVELGDLAKIPITNKDTYRSRMLEEYVDGSRSFIKIPNFTSGTTGEPFQSFFADAYASPTFKDFMSYRFLLWNGGTQYSIARTKIVQMKRSRIETPFRIGLHTDDLRNNQVEIERRLAALNPAVLVSSADAIFDVAQVISSTPNLPVFKPRYVVSGGRVLIPSMRSFIELHLGTEVYDRYGTGEIGVIATECSEHNGMHISSESVIVEIIDEEGNPVPDGQEGRIIVTCLINYNMPFIRYDTIDVGRITYEPCTCGMRTPRLWVADRKYPILTFGNRRVFRRWFVVLFTLVHEIMQYQVVKKSEDHLLLRIVPGPTWNDSLKEKIINGLRVYLDDELKITVETVPRIEISHTGKSAVFVDESTLDNHGGGAV